MMSKGVLSRIRGAAKRGVHVHQSKIHAGLPALHRYFRRSRIRYFLLEDERHKSDALQSGCLQSASPCRHLSAGFLHVPYGKTALPCRAARPAGKPRTVPQLCRHHKRDQLRYRRAYAQGTRNLPVVAGTAKDLAGFCRSLHRLPRLQLCNQPAGQYPGWIQYLAAPLVQTEPGHTGRLLHRQCLSISP